MNDFRGGGSTIHLLSKYVMGYDHDIGKKTLMNGTKTINQCIAIFNK